MSDHCSGGLVDQVLLHRLFQRENVMLVRFLTGFTHCRASAEDLAQLAWLRLISALRRGVCTASREVELRAYLYETARNLFIDECTRKHHAARTRSTDPGELAELLARDAYSPSAEDEVQHRQTQTALQRAMALLPDRQREVVVMWCAGESAQEMARRAGAPYETVLSRKKYAFARMRDSLAPVFG